MGSVYSLQPKVSKPGTIDLVAWEGYLLTRVLVWVLSGA